MRAALALVVVLSAVLASCSLERDLSREFLRPAREIVATPADLGLEYEDVEIPIDSETTLHGWFVPAGEADGRTVVLLHGSRANISYYHPYYRFLNEAGFHVFLPDYRGYGRSTGEPSVNGLFYDLRPIEDWLREEARVGEGKVVWYGISLGSMLALHAGAKWPRLTAGVVAENTVSVQDSMVEAMVEEGGNRAGSTVTAWFARTFHLADDMEAAYNAAELEDPLLLLEGEHESEVGIEAHYETWRMAPEDRRWMWVLPGAGHAPETLLVHDGEYQRSVVEFVRSCFAGGPGSLEVAWERRRNLETGASELEVEIARTGAGGTVESWPVEVTVHGKDGSFSFHRVWLEGERGTFMLAVEGPVAHVSAWRYHRVQGTVEDGSWKPLRTALARAGEVWRELEPLVRTLRERPDDVEAARRLAARIGELEADGGFHPLLEAQLTGAFFRIGEALEEGDPEAARRWYERCVAAEPERPGLHYWPGRPYVAGFPHGEQVEKARQRLQELR